MLCFLAKAVALDLSRAATAWIMTSGWLLAGVMRAKGLRATVSTGFHESDNWVSTHAIWAAPRMPNFSAPSCLAGVGGLRMAQLRRKPFKKAAMKKGKLIGRSKVD